MPMNDIKFERRLTDEQIKKEVALIYQKHAQPYEDETQRPFCQNNLNHWFGSTQQIVPNITKNMGLCLLLTKFNSPNRMKALHILLFLHPNLSYEIY